MATTATPKIVGKAIYLELVADPTLAPDKARSLLGWQNTGTKQIIIFPQYQDDTGKIYEPFIMTRVVSSYTPRSQWEIVRTNNRTKPLDPNKEVSYGGYLTFDTYPKADWDLLTEREKYESRKRDLDLTLRRLMIDTDYEGEGDERIVVAKQGWVVREGKPIVVEVTDEDYSEIANYRKTPQAVIRRINKVRDTLDKFPSKLA